MTKFKLYIFFIFPLLLSSCATYNYAEKVKLVSFDEDTSKGQSIGPIRGEDCTLILFGYYMGGYPSLDKAIINAKTQGSLEESYGLKKASSMKNIRYINNLSTEIEGFNFFFFGNTCLVAKGVGYK